MKNRTLFVQLMVMVVFSPLAIDIFLPAIPLMAQDFAVSVDSMKWSITLFLLTMGLGQLVFGPLADRHGRRPIAIIGIVIYGVCSILSAITPNYEFFIACRLGQGFGACAISVSAFACVRDRFNPLQSGIMYSYLNSTICCIPALAPLLGSVLTDFFGWRSNFEAMAVFAVIAGTFITYTFPETRPESTIKHKKLVTFDRFTPIIKHPVFLFNAVVVMLAMTAVLIYVTNAPVWLMIHLEQDQSSFVFWFSLNAVVNIAACFLAPKALVNFGVRNTIGLGMLVLIASGLLLFLLLEWQHPAGFMIPVMLSSVGAALLMGTCAGQALSPFGNSAGTASALLGFIQLSGAAILTGLIQLLPLTEPEQLAFLLLVFLPIYGLWKLPKFKQVLYQTPENSL